MPLFGGKDKKEIEPDLRTVLRPPRAAKVDHTTPGYGRRYEDGDQERQWTLGQDIGYRAYVLSKAAQADVNRGDGSQEDLASVVDSLEGLYAIAKKIDQLDRTLIDASAGLLEGWLVGAGRHHGYNPGSDGFEPSQADADDWRRMAEFQSGRLKGWVDALDRPAKQEWFRGLLELRGQVLDNLLGALGHVQELRRDMAFLHTAVRAQDLLPEFSIDDARSELLTTEGEARKARELADHAARSLPAGEAPQLSELDAAPVAAEQTVEQPAETHELAPSEH